MWKFYFLIVVLPEISSTLRAGFKKLHYEAQFLEKILQSWVNFHWHLCLPETLISSVLKDIVRKMSRRLYQLKFNRVKSYVFLCSQFSSIPSSSPRFAEHTANTSPKSSSLKCEFGDEVGEITIAVPQPTVCINGSHSYNVQPQAPGSGRPAGSLGLGLLQKSMPLSVSLQNLSQQASIDLPKGGVGDGRRWSFDKPGEEEKAAIAAALEKSGPMLGENEERLGQAAPTEATSWSFASTVEAGDLQGKKQRRNFFSHAGKGQSQPKDECERAHAATDEKQRGWFGSKDSQSKPRWDTHWSQRRRPTSLNLWCKYYLNEGQKQPKTKCLLRVCTCTFRLPVSLLTEWGA